MVGAPACGDVMKLQIRVNPATGVIEDARFKTYGCGSAIASSSLVTEWVKGKTLDQALAIKNTAIAEELALPPVKIHCSILAEDAIKAAVSRLPLAPRRRARAARLRAHPGALTHPRHHPGDRHVRLPIPESPACACGTVLPAGSIPTCRARRREPRCISDTVVAKVAEMLAEEGDPSCSCASSSPAAAARASSTASPSTTRPRPTTCAWSAAPSPWWSTR
jgi:hypothetical protein